MATRTNNIKLGIFVIAGLLLLILALYMIGKNTTLFGRYFKLRAQFKNVEGLTAGSNVRYGGIYAGTVKNVKILRDTVIEVTMLIQEDMKPFIHRNDLISISTDGLMGNKLINITSANDNAPLVQENDILPVKQGASTEAMLETLSRTNNTIARISEDLQLTVQRINSSKALWGVLDDESLPRNIRSSLISIRKASVTANELVADMHAIVGDIRGGKGSLGSIIADTSIAYNLEQAIFKIQSVGENADSLIDELTFIAQSVKTDLNYGNGVANALLKDPELTLKLDNSLRNIEESTSSFNQIMEAIKHSFLFRGYFRRQERRKNER